MNGVSQTLLCETPSCRANDFGNRCPRGSNSYERVRPLLVDRWFSGQRFYDKDARNLTGRDQVLDRELAPLVLLRRANARYAEQRTFCLVQHPHNAQQRGNSSNNNQNGEYRYLSPVEVIVLCQSCLAVV